MNASDFSAFAALHVSSGSNLVAHTMQHGAKFGKPRTLKFTAMLE
jgi:hypothetical protein